MRARRLARATEGFSRATGEMRHTAAQTAAHLSEQARQQWRNGEAALQLQVKGLEHQLEKQARARRAAPPRAPRPAPRAPRPAPRASPRPAPRASPRPAPRAPRLAAPRAPRLAAPRAPRPAPRRAPRSALRAPRLAAPRAPRPAPRPAGAAAGGGAAAGAAAVEVAQVQPPPPFPYQPTRFSTVPTRAGGGRRSSARTWRSAWRTPGSSCRCRALRALEGGEEGHGRGTRMGNGREGGGGGGVVR